MTTLCQISSVQEAVKGLSRGVRITGGDHRGRYIPVLDTPELRPTTERLREAVFSMIQSIRSLEGAVVADLYAGSGIWGFEALSRGARMAMFFEKQQKLVRQLQLTAAALNVEGSVELFHGELPQALTRGGTDSPSAHSCDIIFADPPYDQHPEILPEALSSSPLVNEGTLLIFESARKTQPFTDLFLQLEKDRNYGDSAVRVYSFRGATRERKP